MKNTLKTIALIGVLLAGMVLSLAGCTDKGSGTVPDIRDDSSSTLIPTRNEEGGTFTDARDGKTYRTVRIGSQTWMAENLNYEYNDWRIGSYCYDNNLRVCDMYGRLYTWSAAMDSAAIFGEGGKGCGYGVECIPVYPVRGVCPEGWHLPSRAEWLTLEKFVAGSLFGKTDLVDYDYALHSASGWDDYEGNGSDAFGFGALPAGGRDGDGSFYGVLAGAGFWSATEDDEIFAYLRNLSGFTSSDFFFYLNDYDGKDIALSVRCVKDL